MVLILLLYSLSHYVADLPSITFRVCFNKVPMLLSVFECSARGTAISMDQYTHTMHFITAKKSLIACSIVPSEDTLATHSIAFPLAIINPASFPIIASAAMNFIAVKLALIVAAIFKVKLSVAVFVAS